MFSAAELIEALQRRLRLVAPHLRRPPGEFPVGWQAWFATMSERAGAVTGASAEALVDVLLRRSLATPPRRLGELTRWQAFSTLWRQEWHAPEREDRHWRWFAGGVSLLWHLFFGAIVLWLMYVQYFATAHPPREGEIVVQVEFIGVGTPEEVDGGPESRQEEAVEPAQATKSVEPARSAREEPSRQPTAVATEPPPAAQPPEIVPPEVVQPQPSAPVPVQQSVTVSEPVPDSSEEFVLPPPTLRIDDATLAVPELNAPAPAVQIVEIPTPLPSAPLKLPPARIVQPALKPRLPDVAIREVPTPSQAPIATVPVPSIPPTAAPEVPRIVPEVRSASVPAPSPAEAAPAAAATSTSSAVDAAPQVPAATPSAARPAASSPPAGQRPAATAVGAGPKKTPAPGGWATPRRADDWGDAARNTPGAQRGEDGLFNSDGSVRLAETPGSASPGNPPGTVTEEIANLDRAGTWLKRRPIGYEPTTFDKYWRPNESLLEEWVRKSITTVRIPIPGTNKHIVCQTVLLALGGGCGISDPNLNEQPATARPPPDIPFKPELQEDNGSIRPPSGAG